MSAEVPVIAFAVRGWLDIVHQHHDGLLIGRSQFEEIDYAQQLAYLLDHPDWLERMRAAARKKVTTFLRAPNSWSGISHSIAIWFQAACLPLDRGSSKQQFLSLAVKNKSNRALR